MVRNNASVQTIIDVYKLSLTGNSWNVIEQKLGLRKGRAHAIYGVLEGYLKNHHTGKRFRTYRLAKKMILAEERRQKEAYRQVNQTLEDTANPYHNLTEAIKNLENAVEHVIMHEVNRRTVNIRKEYGVLKEQLEQRDLGARLQDKIGSPAQ